MKIRYVERRFKPSSLAVIEVVNGIVEVYRADGYVLTVRQLYYQFVARDLFPDDRTWSWTGSRWVRDPGGTKNADPNYKWLSSMINDGRLAGLIDWEAIEDRTRGVDSRATWDTPGAIIGACARSYAVDPWGNQDVYVELWVEKEALVGVFERVCRDHRVPWLACRGYVSQSEMWRAATERFEPSGRRNVILHFGDHDPSGIDMTRDIGDRLRTFGADVEVDRVALNFDQVEAYAPPPNPAKATDARFEAYRERFGDESWELDALEPATLVELVEDRLCWLRDDERWEEDLAREADDRAQLERIAEEL
jgi:hypothetical protein